MKDLFKTKTQLLKEWMAKEQYFPTHSVMRWGVENFCNHPDRLMRSFREDGLIQKLTKDEKVFRGFHGKEDVHRWVNAVH